MAPTVDRKLAADIRSWFTHVGFTAERVATVFEEDRLSSRSVDLAVHRRRLPSDGEFADLVRLFILGDPVPSTALANATDAVSVRDLDAAGIIESGEGVVRATVKLVPHGELLIASDPEHARGDDRDWVAGIHPPSVTLARLAIRTRVERGLDVGTGNGVQALLLAKHVAHVVATDVNPRALRYAAMNARLNGIENVECREGSFFEPVRGERFDCVTANPPYVISPESRYLFRDGDLPADQVSQLLVEGLPEHLEGGGFGHVLVSWGHHPDEWRAPLQRWVTDAFCDAWLLHFDSDDPLTHAASWLERERHAESDVFEASLDRWLGYLAAHGISAVGYGAVIMRGRRDRTGWVRAEEATLARGDAGHHLRQLFENQDLLAGGSGVQPVLDTPLALDPSHEIDQTVVVRDGRLEARRVLLKRGEGLGFEVALDEHAYALITALDGRTPRDALAALRIPSERTTTSQDDYLTAAEPVIRRLLELGFLVPVSETRN